MASELASARQAGDKTPAARVVKALLETMLCDLERVRAALRAGARPQQICGINSLTRRALKPDTVAHGPDGDLPDVGAGCPWEDAKVKRAHEAAVEQARRAAADRVELAERAERREQDTNERRARALQQIDSECRRCAECADMDYLICGPASDLMCSKHARRYNELVREAS